MKYIVIVPDGVADEPIKELGDKTPLQVSDIKNINELAKKGIVGMAKTVPDSIPPGSDAANLAVLGYNPEEFLTGRSPLEAASMGIDLKPTDVAFRCNLVTLSEEEDTYEGRKVLDHSGGEISTEEAAVLIDAIEQELGTETIKFYSGVSYRHAMVVENGSDQYYLVPPHDILDQTIKGYMPTGDMSQEIQAMMEKSYEILNNHPINEKRRKEGKKPANSIWIWGQGKKPALTSFKEKFNATGTIISAVDLIKGIGICAGLEAPEIEGATGTIHTNYEGKTEKAIESLACGQDFLYIHVEAPDECSHQGDLEGKIKSMANIDQRIVGPLIDYLNEKKEGFRLLIIPDHPTPIKTRTHSHGKVPFVLYDSRITDREVADQTFDEVSASKGLNYDRAWELMDVLFETGKE